MVCVPKANSKVQICVDLTPLNKVVQHEIHPMATVDENLARVKGSWVFSKVDANRVSGRFLLTHNHNLHNTISRFCFNRLPFGISSASEIFQRTMTGILQGLEGVVCHMDDIWCRPRRAQPTRLDSLEVRFVFAPCSISCLNTYDSVAPPTTPCCLLPSQ